MIYKRIRIYLTFVLIAYILVVNTPVLLGDRANNSAVPGSAIENPDDDVVIYWDPTATPTSSRFVAYREGSVDLFKTARNGTAFNFRAITRTPGNARLRVVKEPQDAAERMRAAWTISLAPFAGAKARGDIAGALGSLGVPDGDHPRAPPKLIVVFLSSDISDAEVRALVPVVQKLTAQKVAVGFVGPEHVNALLPAALASAKAEFAAYTWVKPDAWLSAVYERQAEAQRQAAAETREHRMADLERRIAELSKEKASADRDLAAHHVEIDALRGELFKFRKEREEEARAQRDAAAPAEREEAARTPRVAEPIPVPAPAPSPSTRPSDTTQPPASRMEGKVEVIPAPGGTEIEDPEMNDPPSEVVESEPLITVVPTTPPVIEVVPVPAQAPMVPHSPALRPSVITGLRPMAVGVSLVIGIAIVFALLIYWLGHTPTYGLRLRVDGTDRPSLPLRAGEEVVLIQDGALISTHPSELGEGESYVAVSRLGHPKLTVGEGLRVDGRPVKVGERVGLKPGVRFHIPGNIPIEFRSCVPAEDERVEVKSA